MLPLLLFMSSLKDWWYFSSKNCDVVKYASVLVSAIMTPSVLPLTNSCKSLNLFLIELILRHAIVGFAGYSILRFFNSWEKSGNHERWLFLISFPMWPSGDLNDTHMEELDSLQKFIEYKVGCFWRFSYVYTIKYVLLIPLSYRCLKNVFII